MTVKERTPISPEAAPNLEVAKQRLSTDGCSALEDATIAQDLAVMEREKWPWDTIDGVNIFRKHVLEDQIIMQLGQHFLGKRVMVHCLRQHMYPGRIFLWTKGGPEVGLRSHLIHLYPEGAIVRYICGSHLHDVPAEEGVRSVNEVDEQEYKKAGCTSFTKKTGGKVILDSRVGFEIIFNYIVVVEIVKEQLTLGWKVMKLPSEFEETVREVESDTFRANFQYINPSERKTLGQPENP